MNGYSRRTTEVLDDRLEEDFISFDDACTQSSFTLSIISSLVTGTYPSTHGALRWDDRLSIDLPSLADITNNSTLGEVTAIPAMNFVDSDWGLGRCFDQVRNLDGRKAERNCNQATAEEVCSTARDIVKEQNPFVTLLWFFDLHTPWLSDVEYSGSNPSRDHYDTETKYVSMELEKLFGDLEQTGAYDDTLIILTGDHGEIFDEHHRLPWTATARVGKRVPWLRQSITGGGYLGHLGRPPFEELVHVPLYVKFPDQAGGGTTVSGQVELVDILPTILDQAGIDIPKSIQGQSLIPATEGETADVGKEYVRSELIANPANGHFRMVRSNTHKLIDYEPPSLRTACLDLPTFAARRILTPRSVLVNRDDESNNIIDSCTEVSAELEGELNDWPTEPVDQPRDALDNEKREELKNLGYL